MAGIFVTCRSGLGKRRNIPPDEMGGVSMREPNVQAAMSTSAVVARLDRAIQYSRDSSA
jgi:hypothetical protein